jgi:hypothetical protein
MIRFVMIFLLPPIIKPKPDTLPAYRYDIMLCIPDDCFVAVHQPLKRYRASDLFVK